MTRRIVIGATVALAMAASLTHAPAWAQAPAFDITVTPDEGRPAETFTVTGDATDPTCAEDGVAVRLFYTRPDGSQTSFVVNTTTDAAGHFTAELTVPNDAVAGAPAHVSALVADCTPPGEESVGTRASEAVPFEVLAYEGTFTVSTTTGEPGDTVTFSGTNCWGGDVVVFFGDAEITDVTLNEDKTFSGSFVVPDVPSGTYELGAECPATDYESTGFTVVNPEAPPAPAPPANPVPRRPRYTG